MSSLGVVASLPELIALRSQVSRPEAGQRSTVPWGTPGQHVAQRRSRGMEFAEARPYLPGDDIRTVDWRQTARRGRLYTKTFQEERERPEVLLVDLGATMRFGTRSAFKSVVAAHAAAWLAWCAVAHGDRIGGLVWDGHREQGVYLRGRDQGALNLMRCLADTTATSPLAPARDFASPLRTLARCLVPGSRVTLISDFYGLNTAIARQILALAQGTEIRLVHVYDRIEAEAPPPARYPVTDGQHRQTLDLRLVDARSHYVAAFAQRRGALERLAQQAAIALLPLATHENPTRVLRLPWPHDATSFP